MRPRAEAALRTAVRERADLGYDVVKVMVNGTTSPCAGCETAWRAWLFTTARRRAVEAGRHRQRPESPVPEIWENQTGRTADSAEVALENLATRSALATVTSLPPAQAEVI